MDCGTTAARPSIATLTLTFVGYTSMNDISEPANIYVAQEPGGDFCRLTARVYWVVEALWRHAAVAGQNGWKPGLCW